MTDRNKAGDKQVRPGTDDSAFGRMAQINGAALAPAGVIAHNSAAAEAVAASQHGDCPFCKREGLPVLLTRYAVIPAFLKSRRGHVNGAEMFGKPSAVENWPQLQRHRYTTRFLRQGFVYVYLNAPGKWQVYAVTGSGYLRLLPDPDDIDAKTDVEMSPQCQRKGDNVPARFITIPNPARTPVFWLAFSATPWTAAVRRQYEANPGRRMQRFDCADLIADPNRVADAYAIENAQTLSRWIEDVLGETDMPHARVEYEMPRVGDRNPAYLIWESAYPMVAQTHRHAWGHGQALADFARCREAAIGGKVPAVVLADDWGIAHEVNHTRLHFVEKLERYTQERMRPLTISQSIVGLRKIYEASALEARRRDEEAKGIPDVHTEYSYALSDGYYGDEDLTQTTTRAERAMRDANNRWLSRMQGQYDEPRRSEFQTKYDAVLADYGRRIAQCDADWARCLEMPGWIGGFDDYDPDQVGQRAALTQHAAPVLAGGPLSAAAAGVWKRWMEAPPQDKRNPIYRALFGNDKTALEYLWPEGGDVNQGAQLYDAVKNIADSVEFQRYAVDPLKAAVSQIQLAIGAAVAAIDKYLRVAGQAAAGTATQAGQAASQALQALSDQARLLALRAQQLTVLLYERVEVTLLVVEMTVGEYQRLLSDQISRRMNELDQFKTRTLRSLRDAGGRHVRSLALAGLLSIDDPKVRDATIQVVLWVFERAEEVQNASPISWTLSSGGRQRRATC